MGIKNFTKVFTPKTSKTTLEKAVKDKHVVVDGFSEIYRAFLGMGLVKGLTNKMGDSTQHINIVLCNTIKILTTGVQSLVWVFDTRASELKDKEQEKRRDAKDKSITEQKEIEDKIAKIQDQVKDMKPEDIKEIFGDYDKHIKDMTDRIKKLETRSFKGLGRKMVADIKHMLNCLGIPYIDAPNGIEGEQIAGKLCRLGRADIIITNDTDAPLFGCCAILKKIPKVSGKYDLYTLDDILSQHEGITMDQLIKIGVTLGCDFADKVPRVGPKSVVKKVKDIKTPIVFNEEQLKAIEYFNMDVNVPKACNEGCAITKESIDTLKTWLVKEQSFKQERMDKLMKPLYSLVKN